MANDEFSAFIEEQTAPVAAELEVDWDRERDEWVKHLKKFYEQVEEFMHEYIDQDKVRLEPGPEKTLHEEFIGDYSVDTMALHIGRNKIVFDPIGTDLIGAKGRVDMHSAKGTVKFVLVPQDAASIRWRPRIVVGHDLEPEPVEPVENWTWKIATRPPGVGCVELCKESFQDAVMEVLNG